MAETKYLRPSHQTRSRLRAFSRVFCLCSILVLGACGMQIPFMNKQDNMATGDPTALETKSHMEGSKIEPATPRPSYKNLFGKSLRSDSERLDRMERAVQNMRNEFDSVTPSIRRLMAVEGDMQKLIVELRKMSAAPRVANPAPTNTVGAPQRTVATAPPVPMAQKVKPAPVSTPKVKATPPVQNGKASVYKVRVGEHPGKTRIVLDVNAKTSFKPDVDNGEQIMVIELPEASWGTTMSKSFGRSPFITSYNVEESGGGSLLIFQLKKNAKISYKDDLPSLSGSGRRLVIDLTAG